jgi:hypothetical protein
MRSLAFLTILAMAIAMCGAQDLGKRVPEAVPQPLVRVLTSPHNFVGQPITVAGIFSWGFEEQFLFLTYDHYAMWDTASAVPISLDQGRSGIKSPDLEQYAGYRVKLEGVLLEDKPSKLEEAIAEKGGTKLQPRYYFSFSRVLLYGPGREISTRPNPESRVPR